MSKPQRIVPYKPAQKSAEANNTIYAPQPNKYGYIIRVNHPSILPFYNAYKTELGHPQFFPISEAERLEFEKRVLTGHYPIDLSR